jgi:branched-subunit amino acid transport protein
MIDLSAHPILMMLIAGGIATYMWRFAGVLAVRRFDPASDIMLWVRAVAIAIVAALCTKLALAPPDIVAQTHLASRLAAMAAGTAGFFALRHTGFGVAIGIAVFAGAEAFF